MRHWRKGVSNLVWCLFERPAQRLSFPWKCKSVTPDSLKTEIFWLLASACNDQVEKKNRVALLATACRMKIENRK